MINFTTKPIERWPQEPTLEHLRRHAHFKVAYNDTLEQLSYELARLGVRQAFLQIDVSEHDIRIDGHLRATAQIASPRVIVSAQSKFGPLSLPCDTYRRWQDNIRAITLSLEALRAVDRHGVTKRGEQYRGLKQLAAGTGPINSQEAAAFIAAHCHDAGTPAERAAEILRSGEVMNQCYKAAATALHPDKGGDLIVWGNLGKAVAILREHHGR